MERKVIIWEQKNISLFHQGYLRMRIAICDWDKSFIVNIKNLIYTYAEKYRIDIVVDCYISGEKLLKSNINYNIIFLGYKLDGINGMTTAEHLRKNNSNSSIIFVSEYTEFVFDAFKVNPYRFLRKPVKKDVIFKTLEEYFETFGSDYPLWIKSKENISCLNTGEIYFLEADNKHCFVHLKNEVIECNRTMARVFGVLPKNHFSKINRAYIINLNYIEGYNNEQVSLKNNKTLHISRNYLKSFIEEYRNFSSPKEI